MLQTVNSGRGMKMKRLWNKSGGGEIDARLRDQRPQPSQQLIDRISGEIIAGARPRTIPRTRKVAAIVFASLMLGSTFGAAALAAAGGNGAGSTGKGNGDGGRPAGCVEGSVHGGHVLLHNPNC
jgi:hypothetical protein